MNFIRSVNAAMFKNVFSMFDVIAWVIIVYFATNHSFWWFLTFIPATFISAYMSIMTARRAQYD
jgi:hypothetical protein